MFENRPVFAEVMTDTLCLIFSNCLVFYYRYCACIFSYRPRLWKADYVAATDSGDLHASVTLSTSPTFTHVLTASSASQHAGSSSPKKKFAGYYVTTANEFADVV